MFTFPTPGPAGTSCQAHFYTWAQLSELCSTRLTGFWGRPTPVQAIGEPNLDSRGLKFLESSISHKDLETIFTAFKLTTMIVIQAATDESVSLNRDEEV